MGNEVILGELMRYRKELGKRWSGIDEEVEGK